MQRNCKNMLTASVVVLSVVANSVVQAGQPGGGMSHGPVSISHNFSATNNHPIVNQTTTNSFRSTQSFNSLNSVFNSQNSVKTGNLSNLNSFHQMQNTGTQSLIGKTPIGKTPVNLKVGNNLNNLQLNQKNLHLNAINSHVLNGKTNLLNVNKGLNKQYLSQGPLFNSKFCSPFCSPFCNNKFCPPCWNTFCTPNFWWNCCSCWSPWSCSCWSPFCPQFWSPCYSSCCSPCYSVGLPWLCSVGYSALAYGTGTYAVASGPAIDVELVEVRQIDAGDVQQQLGPAYRVAFRNNSAVDIHHAFSVGAMASTSRQLSKEFPMATVQVSGIKAGATMAADVRLPLEAQRMGINYMGQNVPFAYLYVVVDSNNEINDSNRNNNSTFLGRLDIPMVNN